MGQGIGVNPSAANGIRMIAGLRRNDLRVAQVWRRGNGLGEL